MTPETARDILRFAEINVSRILGYPDEDLAQTVAMEAVRSWSSYDPAKAKLQTWVNTIAQRRTCDLHRKQKRSPVVVEGESVGLATIAEDRRRYSAGDDLTQSAHRVDLLAVKPKEIGRLLIPCLRLMRFSPSQCMP